MNFSVNDLKNHLKLFFVNIICLKRKCFTVYFRFLSKKYVCFIKDFLIYREINIYIIFLFLCVFLIYMKINFIYLISKFEML